MLLRLPFSRLYLHRRSILNRLYPAVNALVRHWVPEQPGVDLALARLAPSPEILRVAVPQCAQATPEQPEQQRAELVEPDAMAEPRADRGSLHEACR